ncbi:MAG: type II toxin-antitoxin system ParD family antitoxin [Acidobacteria bacterium]|nr:MAG: type II toxin-antitoxin system ParD family antitoxin [Acidobacteriota bacterium]
MQVALNSEWEDLVKEKVQSGQYPTPEAVVEEAMRLLKERDQGEGRLQSLLQEAEDSGEASEMTKRDWDNIRREGLARLRTRKPY